MQRSISTRSIANVTVSFGALANFEAKIYAAAREEGSGLNLVAIVDGKVVKPTQQYAVNGKVISWDNLERGIEVGDDSFIVISKSDIEATKAKTNKTVAITKFPSPKSIPCSSTSPTS
jgi:non-homologous end joining protein Ku